MLNPEVESRVPAELRRAIDAARDSIRSGDLEVPRVAFVEGEPDVR